MSKISKSIALVTHSILGGVWTTVKFLCDVLDREENYNYDIFTLASSFKDEASLRLVKPSTWRSKPQMIPKMNDGLATSHVGATMTEFEFQRYKPRRLLTQKLDEYDLIQVVGGSPAWGKVALNARSPICIFAATTSAAERGSMLLASNPLLRVWRRQMTHFTTRAENEALAFADAVFAESVYTQQLLQGKTRPGAMVLGPPGVDANFFVPAASLPAPGAVICVGRLQDPRKNIRLLLEAYAILNRQNSSPPLYLVGRGGISAADHQYIAELDIAHKVNVFSDVPMEQLRDLYRSGSLFVLPSNEEGLGIVILEAMASGLPVVSTDCGGPATAVVPGVTGLLTPVGDAEALANAMRTVLEDPALANQMGLAGRRRVEEHFSYESAGRVYLDVYRTLLENDKKVRA
jgi:D-inositol-3-phosphate glycosyltransferase